MIQPLVHKNAAVAKDILDIQIPAYQVEAALIGFNEIPQLYEDVSSITRSKETFLGWVENNRILGVISYEVEEESVDICRLVVNPNHFGKGIGKNLVLFVIEQIASTKTVFVSTGTKNNPARKLYEKLGFRHINDVEVAPGVLLAQYKK
ncbi:GNAT family N-acetyltransferase [Aquibacillus koreensis]|uniref:GNAT family N-acetyltransferase n=1 Tax=Aquibacillus koreensis TaxID=279446 RepID=A0A9X4AJC4_9BACI|nr:GNAT family N-acetyltransferase [Aquibacillus koreensis]MCT2536167.1 GNAT family N-acetyltransferase [Aquibacillus koreensis]MDC3422092.1 GNAT family N-acetyltransferase [Aquibacillus koreensis]